jgi:hypothetical protein
MSKNKCNKPNKIPKEKLQCQKVLGLFGGAKATKD